MKKTKEKEQTPIITSYKEVCGIGKNEEPKENTTPVNIVYRNISELQKAYYNPRKITKQQKESLRDGMSKFGWAGSYAVINVNPDRKDIIIGGHQRISVWEELGNKTCPCFEVNLSEEDEKELNIRLNKNGGEFDMDLLSEFFSNEDLILYGFTADELPEIDDILDDDELPETPEVIEPLYPIVPKFNEKYSMFCIMTENELDETWFRNVFKLWKMASYKSSAIAPTYACKFSDFQNALLEYVESAINDHDIANSENEVEVL